MSEKKDVRKWWLCENEYCNHPLGKIIEGDYLNPKLIEIEGKNGEKYKIKFNFIHIFCKKCGTSNVIYGGLIGSEEHDKNISLFNDSDLEKNDGWHEEFYSNQFKRNLLLKSLTEKQKTIFEFMSKNHEGEWTIDEAAKKLNIPKDIFLNDMDCVNKKIIEIDHELRKEKAKKMLEEIKIIKSNYEKMGRENKSRI